jgi:hypothetical protein
VLNINVNNENSFDVIVRDMSGKVLIVSKNNNTSASLEVQDFSAGVYVVEIVQENAKTSKRFTKL